MIHDDMADYLQDLELLILPLLLSKDLFLLLIILLLMLLLLHNLQVKEREEKFKRL